MGIGSAIDLRASSPPIRDPVNRLASRRLRSMQLTFMVASDEEFLHFGHLASHLLDVVGESFVIKARASSLRALPRDFHVSSSLAKKPHRSSSSLIVARDCDSITDRSCCKAQFSATSRSSATESASRLNQSPRSSSEIGRPRELAEFGRPFSLPRQTLASIASLLSTDDSFSQPALARP